MATTDTNNKPATGAAAAAGAAKTPATGAAAAAAPAKAAKPPKEPKPAKYADDMTVHFLTDTKAKVEEGKPQPKFGPDHNPKRKDTKSATWFAQYKEGITIKDLKEAMAKVGGNVNANLDWDVKHGFVEVRPAKKAA